MSKIITVPHYERGMKDNDVTYRFSKQTGAVEIEDSRINKWIVESITELENDKESKYYLQSCGDTLVIVFRGDKDECEYEVIVSHDHTHILVG